MKSKTTILRQRAGTIALFALSMLYGCATTPRDQRHDQISVLRLLEQGDIKKAQQAAQSITLPRTLIGMRADNRYAEVVRNLPQHFQIDRAVQAYISEANSRDIGARSLQATNAYANSLMEALRFDEAYRVTATAKARIAAEEKPRVAYVDISLNLNWLLNAHSTALRGLNRWDEAAKELASVRFKGFDGSSVNQVINLALLYAKMGRTKDAEKTLAQLGSNVTPYGLTQAQLVRVIVAEQTNDRDASQRALGYLRQHEEDSLNTLQVALLEADKLDEAASFLISRLQNPDRRFEALREVQDYADYYAILAHSPERVKLRMARWQAVVSRADVQAEIAKVGKVEKYRYRAPL